MGFPAHFPIGKDADATVTLPSPTTAAENSSQDSANELPADLAARGAHRAFGH
jgi:hypothetical protein